MDLSSRVTINLNYELYPWPTLTLAGQSRRSDRARLPDTLLRETCPYDPCERVSLQACSAHQSPVNIGLRHQRVNIIGGNTAAIKNPDVIAGGFAEVIAQSLPDGGVYFLSLRGSGIASGTNGPNRLVGDNKVCRFFCGGFRQSAL